MRQRRRSRLYGHDGKGAAVSSDPVEGHTRIASAPGLHTQIADAVKNIELARLLADEARYVESAEEADDFHIGDDPPLEGEFDTDLEPPEEAADDIDELDVRLDSAFRRVLGRLGLELPDPNSAPNSGGEGGGQTTPQMPSSDADGD